MLSLSVQRDQAWLLHSHLPLTVGAQTPASPTVPRNLTAAVSPISDPDSLCWDGHRQGSRTWPTSSLSCTLYRAAVSVWWGDGALASLPIPLALAEMDIFRPWLRPALHLLNKHPSHCLSK